MLADACRRAGLSARGIRYCGLQVTTPQRRSFWLAPMAPARPEDFRASTAHLLVRLMPETLTEISGLDAALPAYLVQQLWRQLRADAPAQQQRPVSVPVLVELFALGFLRQAQAGVRAPAALVRMMHEQYLAQPAQLPVPLRGLERGMLAAQVDGFVTRFAVMTEPQLVERFLTLALAQPGFTAEIFDAVIAHRSGWGCVGLL